MDKVANTVGHYDAYRKKMDSFTPIYLKVPKINYYINNNKIYNMDANELVEQITPDLIYIDTPYNSRQYSDAYHLLENIIDWKFPKVYGVAKKNGSFPYQIFIFNPKGSGSICRPYFKNYCQIYISIL